MRGGASTGITRTRSTWIYSHTISASLRERGRPFEEILEQYETTVRPMYLEFVEPSKRHADLIVPHATDNVLAVEMIVATLRVRLRAEDISQ